MAEMHSIAEGFLQQIFSRGSLSRIKASEALPQLRRLGNVDMKMNTVSLEQLSVAAFSKLVATKFRVGVNPADVLELELREVTPPKITPGSTPNSPGWESFSLIFLGPVDRLLPQGSYAFESEAVGRFELFIVPIGRDSAGIQYQAAFNRLVKPA